MRFPNICALLCAVANKVMREHKMMEGLELSLAWTDMLAVPRLASRGQGRGTKAVQAGEAAPEDHGF